MKADARRSRLGRLATAVQYQCETSRCTRRYGLFSHGVLLLGHGYHLRRRPRLETAEKEEVGDASSAFPPIIVGVNCLKGNLQALGCGVFDSATRPDFDSECRH